VSEQWALLPAYGTAHLQLTLAALGLGVAVSVPLGVLVARRPRLEGAVLGAASVLQTIPGLALLALMVPLLAGLGGITERTLSVSLPSIGFLPAWIALTLYSVLPVLRNTVTGIASVDPALREAALGVGMTESQRLRRVELPLALPVIVAGVRTAAVWVVGTATLATPVGATSLGNYIFSGLQTRNFGAVVLGSAAAAALAILLDGVIRLLESGLRTRSRGRLAGAGGVLLALVAVSVGAWAERGLGGGERPIRIGAKTFTEQYILAEALAQLVAAETGRPVERVESLGSTVVFDALRNDAIDLYVDYSGTIWATILERDELPESRATVLEDVRRSLAERYGIAVAASLGFENTYALGMRADAAAARDVARISDLARRAASLSIGGDYEFFVRPEWRAIEARYGLAFGEERAMDSALMYQAVQAGEVDVISAYSTDGRIAAYDLVLLEDDRGVIPPYDAIVLASPRLAREAPDVLAAVAALDQAIDAAAMQRMNWAVDGEGRAPAAVARDLVARLRGAPPGPSGTGPPRR